MKKILLIHILVCLLLTNICAIYAYEFKIPENESSVNRDKLAIYDLVDLYYDIAGRKDDSIYSILNYSGVCSIVTVTGKDAGTYMLDEYVAGVVKAEVGAESDKPELLKAQAIAARSYVIATKKNSSDCTVTNGQSYQAFSKVDSTRSSDTPFIAAAQETSGMVVMRNGEVALTQYLSYPNAIFTTETEDKWIVNFQKFSGDASTAWTWEGPSKSIVLAANNYASKSGAPSTTHHFGMSQTIAGWMAKNGKSYEEIINTFYGTANSSLAKLSDGDYIGDVEFVDSEFGQIRYWNQLDFKDYYYSKDVNTPQYKNTGSSWATIATHGCGPTSLAIVLSSFTGRDITPITVTQQVCQLGGCDDGGSYFTYLKKLAEQYGYKTETISKGGNYSRVTSALASKRSLVIVLMGKGTFTNGGHYIVLTGTRSDGYVSVADPASRSRTTKKWYPLNLIVEQMKNSGFLIITK